MDDLERFYGHLEKTLLSTGFIRANDRNFFHFVCSLIFNAWAKNP
jgi:hypothetical protein